MGQPQRTAPQGIQNDPAAMPLPSYEMPWVEVVDPDRTLKRPALRLAPQPNATEEICAEDVLEVVRAGDALEEPPATPKSAVIPLRALAYPTPLITVVPEPSFAPRHAPIPPSPPPAPLDDRADPACLSEPSRPPSSVPPVALDVHFARSRADSTFLLDDNTPTNFRMPRMGLAIAAGLGAMIGVLVLVLALGSAGAKSVSHRGENAVTTKDPAPVAAAPAKPAAGTPTPSVPTFDVASLPRAPVGTVSLATNAAQHRLFVDGALVRNGSTVVSCGKHLVKVGSRGRTQQVDVPCGTDVVVGN